jgi:hypothetical protein
MSLFPLYSSNGAFISHNNSNQALVGGLVVGKAALDF